jgi:glycerophosphoryl diester phosphodiesterase
VKIERRDGRPLVIGHRGAAALAPENTLASLEAAVAAGVDLVEFDVSPGLMLAHSESEVGDDSLSLDDALEFLRRHDVGAHLDVKRVGVEEGVVDAVRRHDFSERAIVSAAYPRTLRRVAALAPDLPRAIGYPRDRYGVSHVRWPRGVSATGAAALRAAMPARIPVLLRWARADVLSLHHTLCSRRAVAVAHALGAPVLGWTANDPAVVHRLAESGVDAIVTDDPSIVRATLEAL